MKYRYRRTYVEYPFRYYVYHNDRVATLTLTKWGALWYIHKLKKEYGV